MALAATACGDSTPVSPTPIVPTASPAVRIAGRLVDYQTGQGAGGTSISWRPISGGATIAVTTDAAGRFDVELPASESLARFAFQIQTGPINFLSGTVRVPGKRLETEIFVNSGQCAGRYGYVFDAVTRQPIAGARVVRAGSAITDATGYYRIDIGCEPHDGLYWGIGTTTISVTHPSYQGTFELDGRREGTSYSGVTRNDFVMQPLSR
jgi:hypothetical protein